MPTRPTVWRAKEPPKRPSWLRVSPTRRPRTETEAPTASAETDRQAAPLLKEPLADEGGPPASTATDEAPEALPKTAAAPKTAPASKTASSPKPESVQKTEQAPETVAKPAATGLLDRLQREFADNGETSAPAKKKPRRGSGFLDRFRRADAKTAGDGRATATSTIRGADMAALSPNDLRHYLTQRIASPGIEEAAESPAAPKTARSDAGPVLTSLDAVLDRVLASATGGLPRALLVAGVSPNADATQAAIGLARALVDRNEQVVLVDLAKGASAVSGPLGMPRVPGFADLAAGRASFADVIRIDEDTPLQVIPAGNPTAMSGATEPDRFMRVFEALTQAYGCVVLHGDLRAVQALMPALKFELPAMVAVLPRGGSVEDEDEALRTFQSLGCPVVAYEGNGKQRRMGLFNRIAAV
ncbi:hypothetical protein [Methyloceanibacter superfactus]|uniref:hypothetical protein n=1 Tax=Methyloceanibacter superfactus TaxID=1774969 RepID=UPI00114CA0AB|nr:hypothetical protein [Methyloceanibacter superfactus]